MGGGVSLFFFSFLFFSFNPSGLISSKKNSGETNWAFVFESSSSNSQRTASGGVETRGGGGELDGSNIYSIQLNSKGVRNNSICVHATNLVYGFGVKEPRVLENVTMLQNAYI